MKARAYCRAWAVENKGTEMSGFPNGLAACSLSACILEGCRRNQSKSNQIKPNQTIIFFRGFAFYTVS
jgi:hypothetical protein